MALVNTSPSAILADSLASLSRAAHSAFTEVESQARAEVARAVADAQDARNQRDNALEAQHALQLEGQAWKQEVLTYKASLKQAEISISHQTETIAQLRREVSQWKDQSRNWQEHFLRVEQERCTLSSRLDSLVAERLQWTRPFDVPTPLTPQHQFTNAIDSAPSSTTTKRASTSSCAMPLISKSTPLASTPQLDSPLTSISAHKSARSQTKPAKLLKAKALPPEVPSPDIMSKPVQKPNDLASKSQKVAARIANPAPTGPRQTIIRRVQAVIHVKQEEEDDILNSGLEEQEQHEQDVQMTRRSNPRKRRKVVLHDDEEREDGDQEMVESPVDEPGNDYSAEEDGAENPSEEEDDELMLGAEDNHREVYGTQRVNTTKKVLRRSGTPVVSRRRKTIDSTRDKPPMFIVRKRI